MLPPMGQHGEDGDRKIGRELQKTNATRTNFAAHFIPRSIASARHALGGVHPLIEVSRLPVRTGGRCWADP